MSKKVNTTQTVTKPKTDTDLEKEMEKLAEQFRKEKKVKFSIPVQFAKHIGSTLYVGVNGSGINIPVDGKEYEIPETFAKHAQQALNNLTT